MLARSLVQCMPSVDSGVTTIIYYYVSSVMPLVGGNL